MVATSEPADFRSHRSGGPDCGPTGAAAGIPPVADGEETDHEHWKNAVEEEFTRMVVVARNAMRDRAAALDPSLLPYDFKVFTTLWHHQARGAEQPGLTSREITALLESDKSMVSRSLKRLEEIDFVQRTTDPHDARAQRISITERGCSRYRDAGSAGRHDLREQLRNWDQEQLRALAELLHKLNGPLPDEQDAASRKADIAS